MAISLYGLCYRQNNQISGPSNLALHPFMPVCVLCLLAWMKAAYTRDDFELTVALSRLDDNDQLTHLRIYRE